MSGSQLPYREGAMHKKGHQGVSGVLLHDIGGVKWDVHFVHIYQAVPYDLGTSHIYVQFHLNVFLKKLR